MIKLLRLIIKLILELFQPKPPPEPVTQPVPVEPEPEPEPLKLTHPEEPKNDSQTIDNVDVDAVLTKWLVDWQVPPEHWYFWRNKIVVQLDPSLNYPAATWEISGIRYLAVRPEYCNAGVIAHEQAHNSYALLTDGQKLEFSATYNSLKDTDPLIRFLYCKNTYGLTSDVEGMAEIYRYLGDKVPNSLKPFYPKLFDV